MIREVDINELYSCTSESFSLVRKCCLLEETSFPGTKVKWNSPADVQLLSCTDLTQTLYFGKAVTYECFPDYLRRLIYFLHLLAKCLHS